MKKSGYLWTGGALLFLVVYTLPFVLYGKHPLGYDTGFYRRFLNNPFNAFPSSPVPGLDHTIIAPRVFMDLLRLSGLPVDVLLYGSYILLFACLLYVLYRFAALVSTKRVASLTVLIVCLSPVLYQAYWFMFYKNIFTLSLFFIALYALEKRFLWVAFIASILIPISHQGTTIIFMMVFGLFIGLRMLQKKGVLAELLIFVSTMSMYLYFHPRVAQKVITPPTGIFLERAEFLLLILPLVMICLCNLPAVYRLLQSHTTMLALSVVAILFPLLSLPYHQRVFLLTSFVLALFAAHVLGGYINNDSNLSTKKRWSILILCGIALLVHLGLLGAKIVTLRPILSDAHISALEQMEQIVPPGASIVTSARLTPWVQGWSQARVFAPGVLKDVKGVAAWERFWGPDVQYDKVFLDSFPKPLFLFIDDGERALFIPPLRCVSEVSPMLYQYDC